MTPRTLSNFTTHSGPRAAEPIRFDEHLPWWRLPADWRVDARLADWRVGETPRRYDAALPHWWWELPVLGLENWARLEGQHTRRKFERANRGHMAYLDARPYLEAPAPQPGPLFRLHDFLAQLDRTQPLETPVRVTRVRATDVVPLPAGVRGKWEGWSVDAWRGAVAPDLTAGGHGYAQELDWRGAIARGDDTRTQRLAETAHGAWDAQADEVAFRRALSTEPPVRKPRRTCEMCGKPLPKGARADKRTHRGACSQKAYRQRKAAA